MRQYLLILALAAFWGISGLVASFGLNAMFGGNAGLLLLLIATRNPDARRIFYEGPRGEEPGVLFLALLWVFPIVLVFAGMIWWLLGQFFH
jgi:hypothetical protein